jgi:hypothetical protein
MRRIVAILSVGLLTVVAASAWAVHVFWDQALARGRELTERVRSIEGPLTPAGHGLPLVFWLGDSTFYETDGAMYPQLIRRRSRATVTNRIIALPGLDFFGYFSVVGRALESHPQLIVVVANPRLFRRDGGDESAPLMSVLLPRGDLVRALLLPWYARGATVPRILLDRLLWSESLRDDFLFAEGLRSMFHARPWMTALAIEPEGRTRAAPFVDPLEHYDKRITPDHPVTRMMAATVALATSHGVRILVLIPPVPISDLQGTSWYDERRYDGQMRLLAEVVARNGGEYLDLHRELSAEEFHDLGGHYTARGAEHLADIIEPVVSSLLAEATMPVARSRSRADEEED